jgi:1,4-dihydroxy-2-naphthoate octaprenyltransferase
MAATGASPLVALALVSVVVARRPVISVLSGTVGPGLIAVLADTGRVQIAFGALAAVGLAVAAG